MKGPFGPNTKVDTIICIYTEIFGCLSNYLDNTNRLQLLASLWFCRVCTTCRSTWAAHSRVCSLARPTWAYAIRLCNSGKCMSMVTQHP